MSQRHDRSELTALSTTRGIEDVEVVFAVLPALELEINPIRKRFETLCASEKKIFDSVLVKAWKVNWNWKLWKRKWTNTKHSECHTCPDELTIWSWRENPSLHLKPGLWWPEQSHSAKRLGLPHTDEIFKPVSKFPVHMFHSRAHHLMISIDCRMFSNVSGRRRNSTDKREGEAVVD